MGTTVSAKWADGLARWQPHYGEDGQVYSLAHLHPHRFTLSFAARTPVIRRGMSKFAWATHRTRLRSSARTKRSHTRLTANRTICAFFVWNVISSPTNSRTSSRASNRAAATQRIFETISSWTRSIFCRRTPTIGCSSTEEGRAGRDAIVCGERLRGQSIQIASWLKARKPDVPSVGRQNTGAQKSKPRVKRGSYADPLGYPTHGVDPFGRVDA